MVEELTQVKKGGRKRKVGASNLVKRAQRETKMRISASHAWR